MTEPTLYYEISKYYSVLHGTIGIFITLLVLYWLKSNNKIPFISLRSLIQTQRTHTKFKAEKSIYKEAYIAFKLSISLALTMVFEVGIQTVISIFLGHLPNASEMLSATTLATSFCNMLPVVVTWGLSSALWTLIPQAVGSNQSHLLALYSQRAFIICTAVGILFSFVLLFAENILKFIGIASDGHMNWNIVSNYSMALIPYPFLMTYLSILHRVGQNSGHNVAITVIQSIVFFLTIPLCYLFIISLHIGYIGGALTLNISLLLSIIMLTLYLVSQGHSYIFKPLPFHQICETKGIYQFCKFGFPGCLQLSLSWIIRELIIILTGYVTHSSVALLYTAIMYQLYAIKFFHTGLANAYAIRIGKYIGYGSIMHVKRSIKMQMCFELFLIAISFIVYTTFSYEIISLVTNNKKLIPLINDKLIYVCLFNVFGVSIKRNIDAIYRVLGYQKLTLPVLCVSQYLIALPLQLYLLWNQISNDMVMGLYIVWNVSSFGYYLSSIVLIFMLIFYVDWNKAVEESKARIKINNENIKPYLIQKKTDNTRSM